MKQELLNASVEIDLQGCGKADVIFERDFDDLIDKLAKKLPIYSVSKRCFCGAEYDGIECNNCGFDASEIDIY